MKKLFLALCLTSFAIGFSQEEKQVDFKKNEIKGNALFLVIGAAEFSYERILNDYSGVGASVFFAKEDESDTTLSLTPYYRAYFGKKPAAGFFVEGFGMLSTGLLDNSQTKYEYVNGNSVRIDIPNTNKKYTDFALGFGVGAKWVHKRGYVFEINGGVGRNFIQNNSPEVVGRGGITLGYRF